MMPDFIKRLLGAPKIASIESERQKLAAQIGSLEANIAAEIEKAQVAAQAAEDARYNADTLGKMAEHARAEKADGLRHQAEVATAELRARLAPLQLRAAELDQALTQEAERERLRRLSQLRLTACRHAHEADELATACGEALQKLEGEIRKVVELVDTPEAYRVLSIGGILHDTRKSLPRRFLRAGTQAEQKPVTNNFLPLDRENYPRHDEAQILLVNRIQSRLDLFVRIFATEAEAEQARRRSDSSGENFHVVRDDAMKCFRLVEGRVRGISLAEAERPPGDAQATLLPAQATTQTSNDG
jgi:hypothetical protein